MNKYSDYTFYISTYGGEALTEAQFDKAIRKASAWIDRITFGRAKDYPRTEELQICACEMAEAIRTHEASLSEGKVVKSVSNQGYTETYATPEGIAADKQIVSKLADLAVLYLPDELLEMCIYED